MREYPDHGDGFGDYHGPLNEDTSRRPSGSKRQRPLRKSRHKRSHSRESETKTPRASKSRSRTRSRTRSRSRSRTRSRSKTRSKTRSRSHSRAPTRSCSGSRRQLSSIKPGFLDAFRVMYLTPSKHKKSTTKYLATQKRQDRVHEILKSDRLGSKRWYFYPRQTKSEPGKGTEVPGTRDNCDQRIKIDGDFLRHYKRSKNYDADAPISKLKRWEIQLYKRLGFIQAV
ncbi:calcium homeostasis endoplasmic reticulum protein-like [Hyposmocoma kahamanoa]|uniref:calcium homeostasis endoplasmic reticulum protein-like n=1 Tax=Hyposmocoma kahamanoa TaxID=1477025 RepID=UPI000E6D6B4C|nr:calcium homeostasis endoplasmic reticulum protein-like [Hyposmocoma kahamanoa]